MDTIIKKYNTFNVFEKKITCCPQYSQKFEVGPNKFISIELVTRIKYQKNCQLEYTHFRTIINLHISYSSNADIIILKSSLARNDYKTISWNPKDYTTHPYTIILYRDECITFETNEEYILSFQLVECFIEKKRKYTEETQTVENISDDYERLIQMSIYSDFTIKVEEQVFNVHKLKLIERSTFFQHMFSHEVRETCKNEMTIIDTDSKTFVVFLKYLYCGKIDEVNITNNLLVIADRYGVSCLVEKCRDYLRSTINMDNAIVLLFWASSHNCKSLVTELCTFIARQLKTFKEMEQFEQFFAMNNVMCSLIEAIAAEEEMKNAPFKGKTIWENSDDNGVYWKSFYFHGDNTEMYEIEPEKSYSLENVSRVTNYEKRSEMVTVVTTITLNILYSSKADLIVFDGKIPYGNMFRNKGISWNPRDYLTHPYKIELYDNQEITFKKSKIYLPAAMHFKLTEYFIEIKNVETHTVDPISDDYEKLIETSICSDFTITVEEQVFNVHKFKLIGRSSFFQRMFCHEVQETSENEMTIIDTDSKTFRVFLKYLYCGKIDEDNITNDLLVIADKYGVLCLVEKCADYLISTINMDNAIELLLLAGIHNCKSLITGVCIFVARQLKTFKEMEEFKQFFAMKNVMCSLIEAIIAEKELKEHFQAKKS